MQFRFWVRCAFPVICVFLSFTCAHKPVNFTFKNLDQPVKPETRPGNLRLSPEQITSDVNLLLYALDRGYAGKKFVPASDWERLNHRLESLRGRAMEVSEFCDQVGDALWQVPDAHLNASRFDLLRKKSISCGDLRDKNARLASVGKNVFHLDKNQNWFSETLSGGDATLGVMSITWFPDQGEPAWNGFDAAVFALMKNHAIIIDLRGNGGGDDRRGYQLAKSLVDGDVWGGSGTEIHYRETPETLTLLKNTLDRIGRQEDGSMAEFMKEQYAKVSAARAEAAAGKKAEYRVVSVPPPRVTPGPRAFQGPIAILVDEECSSSCESSLFVLRQHPHARVFGARTGGYIHFGNVGSLGLPESGIRVGIPTKYNEFPNGQFYDKVGFEPDVVVPSGTNAFDVATTWLREEVPTLGRLEKAQVVP